MLLPLRLGLLRSNATGLSVFVEHTAGHMYCLVIKAIHETAKLRYQIQDDDDDAVAYAYAGAYASAYAATHTDTACSCWQWQSWADDGVILYFIKCLVAGR